MKLVVSADADETFYVSILFSLMGSSVSLRGIKLLSLEDGKAYCEIGESSAGLLDDLAEQDEVELFPVFGGLPDGVDSVDVFLPNVGVALGVPVLDAASAGFDVDAALAAAEIDESIESGPFELNSVAVAADGSSDTEKDDASTTVNVSGDVLFATDSADLSAEADELLGTVVEQLALYPSGGELAVTGHTDDVNTDEHNQDLSERRAEAVSVRLGELTNLSGWETVVLGKGESEPRVPNDSDENRQLNRRVEILLTPADPSEAGAAGSGAGSAGPSGDMPEPTGPVGPGSDGVDVQVEGVNGERVVLRVAMDSVTRVGGYLVGTVHMVADGELTPKVGMLDLPEQFVLMRMWAVFYSGAPGFTLLNGDDRYLLVDFTDGDEENIPLTTDFVYDFHANDDRCFPVVWPDAGGDAVTMDIIGRSDDGTSVAARLTDIPVIEA
ncbi:OmpA family protein [Actinomyces qiguomingii]|uniref:OmpA family protein n=1 Tax=Actinomyces qiguomingii TaxID=2057800 RepID=UPI001E48724A|nr:OmpA family protein [Actinomyces qiguomingii]